ncbi:MAG TPA: hypothetical protein VHD56_11775 [Tepidisphaeraceae bacterium]|nr:hypothetical protein [Tepidisphaeraceae bacterium]
MAISPVAGQDDDASRAQVSAAVSDASAALRAEIVSTHITPAITVGQFIQKTQSQEDFDVLLQRAQQIGGPRWIDPQTCQVKLELSAQWVATLLISSGETHAKQSPIPSPQLEQLLTDWRTRTFTGTGTSIATQKLSAIRPVDAGDVWTTVSEKSRADAVAAARQDAINLVLQSIQPVQMTRGQTVGDLLTRPLIQQRVNTWLQARPVTQIRFKDDLQVEVIVSVPPTELFNYMVSIAPTAADVPLPTDEQGQRQFRADFLSHVPAAIGRAGAVAGTPKPIPLRIDLPAQPPAWVNMPLEAEAIAPRAATPLRTKSNAETNAAEVLRVRVGALRLKRNIALDELAEQNPAINDAITRSLLRARVGPVEYRSDGSVLVRLSIDGRDLWQELRQAAD